MPVGMEITPLYAWQNIEVRAFEFWCVKLEANANTTAFMDELPKALPSATATNVWAFTINGGSTSQQVPLPFWSMSATLVGWCISRYEAKRLWGRVAEILGHTANPHDDFTFEGLVSMRYSNMPDAARGLREVDIDTDGTEGGQHRVWEVTIPIEVDFVNSEPEVGEPENVGRNEAKP